MVAPYHFRGFLYIHKPPVVFKARVDNPEGQIYPTREINFDNITVGDYTDIKPGMTVMIGSTEGAYDLGRQRIKSAHPTHLQIGWSSLGTHDGEVKLSDDAYITVVNERLMWGKTPYIQIADGRSFKDYDIDFDPDIEHPPVANGGPGFAEFIDPITEVITVGFDAANSFAPYPGANIADVEWDVIDGTITVGSATDDVITAEFPAGFRYVELKITDTRGNSHIHYIPVYGATPTGQWAPIFDFEALPQTLTPEGGKISFVVFEDIPTSTFPDSTLVMYWEHEWYDNVKGSINGYPGREHMKFIGFINTEPTRVEAGENANTRQVTLECVDVAGRLALLPGFSQVVRRAANPTSWLEMTDANTDRYLHYLLHWHTSALELADFYVSGTGDIYHFASFTSDGADFYQQVDGRAQATGTGYRLTSDSQGILRVVVDPLNQEAGDRTSEIQADVDEGDLSAYGYSKQHPPRIHWARTAALIASDQELTLQNVVHSIAPGAAPGQGVSSQELNNRLVVSQQESNLFTGNAYERANAPESMFDFDFVDGGILIEPAHMEWLRATTTSRSAAQRGLIFTNERFLPTSVTISRSVANGSKVVAAVAERETIGNPAATHVPPKANLPAYTLPSTYFGQVLDPAQTGFAGETNFGMFSTDGYLYRTGSFNDPTWERFDLGVTGTPFGFTVNAYSPRYLDTGSAVNGWLVTGADDGVRIYYVTDIFATTPTVTLKFTSSNVPSGDQFVAITSERQVENLVNAAWFAPGVGTRAVRTIDNSTFTEVAVTNFLQTNGFDTMPGVAIGAGNEVWCSAYSATGADDVAAGKIYKSLDSGATWALSHGTLDTLLSGVLHIPFADNPAKNKMWYMRRSLAINEFKTVYYDGSTEHDRSPTNAGGTVGGLRSRAIATNPTNANQVFLCGISAGPTFSAHKSTNGGLLWAELDTSAFSGGTLLECDVDSNGNVYVWGNNGSIGFVPNFGDGIQDRRANISAFTPGAIIGIVGG